MTRDARIHVRIPESVKSRWEKAAKRLGYADLTSLIEQSVEAQIGPVPARVPSTDGRSRRAPRRRSGGTT